MAFGPKLDADGLIRLVVPLDPIDGVGRDSARRGDDQHIDPRRLPQPHLLAQVGYLAERDPFAQPMFARNDRAEAASARERISVNAIDREIPPAIRSVCVRQPLSVFIAGGAFLLRQFRQPLSAVVTVIGSFAVLLITGRINLLHRRAGCLIALCTSKHVLCTSQPLTACATYT